MVILYRNQHDITTIKEVFGDSFLTSVDTVKSSDPKSVKKLLQSQDTSVRSCFIVVESSKIKEELAMKSNSTIYQDLLKTAVRTEGKNIFTSRLFVLTRRCKASTETAIGTA